MKSAVCIVGAGPAGVAASLHLLRQRIPVCLFDRGPVGGLLRAARRLENLPGFPGGLTGRELAERMEEQLAGYGLFRNCAEVLRLQREENEIAVHFRDGPCQRFAAVILATGTLPVPLPFPWRDLPAIRAADELAADLSGQDWLVAGGGDAAADTALSIAARGGRPRLLLRQRNPRWHGGLEKELIEAEIPRVLNFSPELGRIAPGGRVVLRAGGREESGQGLVCCFGRCPSLPDMGGLGERDGVLVAGEADGREPRYALRAMASGIVAAERIRGRLSDGPACQETMV